MENRTVIIGLDVGHSATKMTFDTESGTVERTIFPSLACPAIELRDETEALKAADDTVIIDGRAYFTGETAQLQGSLAMSTGLFADWISTKEHAALLSRARKMVDQYAGEGERIYCLGLPVNSFAEQREALKRIALEYLGGSVIVRVAPQPVAGYSAHMLNRKGVPQLNRAPSDESWAIIDVGHYSSDFILMLNGRWIEAASGGCAGMRAAIKHIQDKLDANRGIKKEFLDVEIAMRKGFLKDWGETIDIRDEIADAYDVLAEQVFSSASELFERHIRSLDGVLVIGGGAGAVLGPLQKRWQHARVVEDTHLHSTATGPRFIVSEGLYRLGRNYQVLRDKGLIKEGKEGG